jgi:cell division protein FtsZ
VSGVQFIAMNTDQQSLAQCRAEIKISLGPGTMRGLGAGGDPERGMSAAEESREEILACLNGADMVFITAGMGGGTGTGAAPVIASCAAEIGTLAVAVVITPFFWEGRPKMQKATDGLNRLRDVADSVIVVSNEKLKDHIHHDTKTKHAYEAADSVLIQGVKGITDLILRPGIINGDFADVKAVLCNSREALIGTGMGRGDEPVKEGVRKALECPLLERDQQGSATKVIVSVMADWDRLPLLAVEDAMNYLMQHYQGQPDIKLCSAEAPELEDRVLVTILASGFDAPPYYIKDAFQDYGAKSQARQTLADASWQAPTAGMRGAKEPPARQAAADANAPAAHVAPMAPAASSTQTVLVQGDASSGAGTTKRVGGRGQQPPPTPSGEMQELTRENLDIPTVMRKGQGIGQGTQLFPME